MPKKSQQNRPMATTPAEEEGLEPTPVEGEVVEPIPAEEKVVAPTPPTPVPPQPPLEVLYCRVCTCPLEYCEFGPSTNECKDWLKENHRDLYNRYYSPEALQAKSSTLSSEAQAKMEKDSAKKRAKADAKADAALLQKQAAKVIIERQERTKRKCVTSISGLDAFGIDLKKAAKQIASSLATGASVTKDEPMIVVQGDVGDLVSEMIIKGIGVLQGVPEDKIGVKK